MNGVKKGKALNSNGSLSQPKRSRLEKSEREKKGEKERGKATKNVDVNILKAE